MALGHAPHVLLTGANGFIASHILSLLIDRGYTITATVRAQSKADDIIKTHPLWKDKVNFMVVSDFTSSDEVNTLFENATEPFNYVIHTASPLLLQVRDVAEELIEPTVKGTRQMLRSAYLYGGTSLKRFVLLGSAVSVVDSFPDPSVEGSPYTEADWNTVTAEQAIKSNDPLLGYIVAKVQAERTAWEFIKIQNPKFDLVVIDPFVSTGPLIHPVHGPDSINSTNHLAIASFIDGTHKKVEDVRAPFYYFVDVHDVARAHVDAMSNPAASGQRIVLVAGLITPQLVVNSIRKHFPALKN